MFVFFLLNIMFSYFTIKLLSMYKTYIFYHNLDSRILELHSKVVYVKSIMPPFVYLVETTTNQTNLTITTCHLSSSSSLPLKPPATYYHHHLRSECLTDLLSQCEIHLKHHCWCRHYNFELNSNFFWGKYAFAFVTYTAAKNEATNKKILLHFKQMEILKTTSIRETKATNYCARSFLHINQV